MTGGWSIEMSEEEKKSEVIIDGCRVIDKGNGLSSFVPCDGGCGKQADEDEPIGFFARVLKWFKTSKVTPYAKVKDLADPLWKRHDDIDDRDVGSNGKTAVEVGIKVKF